MIGRDLIMATLLGSGGGSSGSGGDGSAGVSPKEVNFYDYDGVCLYAYTVAEAQALSELPAGPEHPGLVFQGWNWSLEGVKGLTRAMNIGAMYTTDDGTTRLYITLQEGRTSPMLGVGVNGTVTVDWGDGTAPDVLTGTSTSTTKWTPNHAYDAPGDYVIRLTVDGEMAFIGKSYSYSYVLGHSTSDDTRDRTYLNALHKVEIGDNVTGLLVCAFSYCRNLTAVALSNSIKSCGDYAFEYSGLKSVSLPIGINSCGYAALRQCYQLELASLPENMDNIASNMFYVCYDLKSVFIPNSVTTIGDQAFSNCYILSSISMPDSVKTVGSNTFAECHSLAFVAIPGSITSFGGLVFYNCYGLAVADFTRYSEVPPLSKSNVFNGVPNDLEIRVPAALYDEWIAATNWATYASYIKAY